MRKDRGFTLIEVMVAIVILSVGILGLTATAALVTTMAAQARRETELAALARGRLERLRAADCETLASGSAGEGPFLIRWTIATEGALRRLTVTVQTPTPRGMARDSLTALRPC